MNMKRTLGRRRDLTGLAFLLASGVCAFALDPSRRLRVAQDCQSPVSPVLGQAARASGEPAEGSRTGDLVEFGDSNQIFHDPKEKETQQYIKGDFS
jgi:hypothetical protein